MKIWDIYEIIIHDKDKKCGWNYREIKYRVDFKTRKTRFVKYMGYCQWDFKSEYGGDVSDDFVERISIHSEYTHFPLRNDNDYKKKVRSGHYSYKEGKYKFNEVNDL